MPLPLPEQFENPYVEALSFELLPVTLGEAADAVWRNTVTTSEQMGRSADDFRLSGRTAEEDLLMFDVETPDTGPMMEAAEINEQYAHLGLRTTDDMPAALVKAKVERLQKKAYADYIVSKGPQHFGATAAKFGVALIKAATDPVEVAAAFVPILGPARRASLLKHFQEVRKMDPQMARNVTRTIQGGVEGTVGAAIVEPVHVLQSKRDFIDYGLRDAALNIALGGALGVGLHVGAGRIADYAKARRAQQLQAIKAIEDHGVSGHLDMLAMATAQLIEGRNINIEAYRGASFDQLQTVHASIPDAPARVPVLREVGSEGISGPAIYRNKAEAEAFMQDLLKQDSARKLNIEALEDGSYAVREDVVMRPIRDADGQPRLFGSRKRAEQALKRTTKNMPRTPKGKTRGVVKTQDGNWALVEGDTPAVKAAEKTPDRVDFTPTAGKDFAPNVQRARANSGLNESDMRSFVEREYAAENQAGVNQEALRQAKDIEPDVERAASNEDAYLDDEIATYDDELTMMRNSDLISEEEMMSVDKEFVRLREDEKNTTEAIKAMAGCLVVNA